MTQSLNDSISGELMEEQLTELSSTAARLASAAEALEAILTRLDAQQEALNVKVDRIVAAIDEGALAAPADALSLRELQERTAQLERDNAELKAQAARAARKTLPPLVSALLTKSCGLDDGAAALDAAALDKALGALSLEQRIAVKAEMARAGMIE
jgi:hypothetical protein